MNAITNTVLAIIFLLVGLAAVGSGLAADLLDSARNGGQQILDRFAEDSADDVVGGDQKETPAPDITEVPSPQRLIDAICATSAPGRDAIVFSHYTEFAGVRLADGTQIAAFRHGSDISLLATLGNELVVRDSAGTCGLLNRYEVREA